MTPERWQIVKGIFDGAVQEDASIRAACLDRLCRHDPSLREEVEALLASDERADGFMEKPVVYLGRELISNAHEGRSKVGSLLVHYRVVSKLGSGGMGDVYLAEDTRLGRKIALKVLAPEWLDSPTAHARFQREARLASSLDHPNICMVYDVGHADGVSFIAMQYLEGKTLKDILRRGPVSVADLLSIATQVADALAAAHARGIVHCDVKCSNVIVSPDGRAHVLDFGIARLLSQPARPSSHREATQSGPVFGTPAYLSPEQARGHGVDHRSDVFSFGVMLYEMATGQVPFARASAADTIAAILTEPHLSPSKMHPDVPPSVVKVIDRALAKDPADRYQSMDELKADLHGAAEDPGTVRPEVPMGIGNIPRDGTSTTPVRPAWMTRWPVLAAAAAVVLGIGIAGVYRTVGSAEAIEAIAVLPFTHPSDAGDLEYLSYGLADGVLARLSELPAPRVIARSTTSLYKDHAPDPRAIGRGLGVNAVVTGEVSRRRDRIVVGIELVDVKTGSRLWGGEYSRPISELFAIPADVALAVSRELRTRLTGDQRRRLTRDYTRSTDAYQLYLKGRFFSNKRTAEEYTKAIEHFTAAVEKDPTFALAYSGLADSYLLLRAYGIRSDDVVRRARSAAERALQIDDSLAEAYTSLGKIESDTYRWAEAETAFKQAVALNPSYATAHHWFAMHLAQVGRLEEAMTAIRRAQALDPLSLIINTEVGRLLYLSRHYDAAIAQYSTVLDMDPGFALAHLHLGMALVQKGAYSEALAEFDKAAPVGGLMPAAGRARAYALAGRRQDAEAILRALLDRSTRDFVPPYVMAMLYVSLQDHERALDWLEKGTRDGGAWFLKVNPPWDSLQSNPRYQTILRGLRLAPDHVAALPDRSPNEVETLR